jgi:hypothetical protein
VKQKIYFSEGPQALSVHPGIGGLAASEDASKFAGCKVMGSDMLERGAEEIRQAFGLNF